MTPIDSYAEKRSRLTIEECLTVPLTDAEREIIDVEQRIENENLEGLDRSTYNYKMISEPIEFRRRNGKKPSDKCKGKRSIHLDRRRQGFTGNLAPHLCY